jgi:hypothetical protein
MCLSHASAWKSSKTFRLAPARQHSCPMVAVKPPRLVVERSGQAVGDQSACGPGLEHRGSCRKIRLVLGSACKSRDGTRPWAWPCTRTVNRLIQQTHLETHENRREQTRFMIEPNRTHCAHTRQRSMLQRATGTPPGTPGTRLPRRRGTHAEPTLHNNAPTRILH